MKQESVHKLVVLVLVLLISVVFLTMIKSFLMPLFMAGLISALSAPLHSWLTEKLNGRHHIASLITIIGLVLLIIGPLSILITIVVGQAITIGHSVTPWVQTFIDEPSIITEYMDKIPFYKEVLPYRDEIIQKAGELVGTISTFLIDSLSSVTKVTISAIFGIVIMLYIMFYFLTMGHVLLEKILYFLPLMDKDEQALLKRFTSVTRATIKGTIIIGIMQGTICGTAFALAGIEGAVFWGTVMAVVSVIPAFGTSLVWVPAMIILALLGDFTGVIILGVICGLISGNLDNIVRPRLVGKDTEMHDLFVLFGTLGGITMFGILGIVIGPIIAALFITIWEIYGTVFKDYLPEVGPELSAEQPEQAEDNKE